MKKTEDVLASIITTLTDLFGNIKACNVKWIQISFYNCRLFLILIDCKLKDKTAKIYWVLSKNVSIILQTDNGAKFEYSIMNQFWLEINIQLIFGTPYYSNTKAKLKSLQNSSRFFLTRAMDYQKIIIFLTILYVTFYCTIKIDFTLPQRSPLTHKATMNASDNELMGKIRKNTLKRRLKAKTVSGTYPDGSNVRVSNYIKIIDKEHVCFRSKGLQKYLVQK